MESNVIYNKTTTIERCIKRINEIYEKKPLNLKDMNKQDLIILNLERACQATIDMAMHVISSKRLGLPQSSKNAFEILAEEKIIKKDLCEDLKSMVGFRNVAIHDYQDVDLKILQAIVEEHLGDLLDFCKTIIKY